MRTETDEISPAYINIKNPKYLEIDNFFYMGLIITNYYREQNDILLKTLLETNVNINISIFYEKQNQVKTIKELTYHIGNVKVDIQENNENREDIDIAISTYNDAKYIRKEMQINGEDLYFLYIYLDIFNNDKEELENDLNKIEGILQSKGIQTIRANFRQDQVFKACLPFMDNKLDIKNSSRRNILTSSLVCTYPFVSSTIFDEERYFYWKKYLYKFINFYR